MAQSVVLPLHYPHVFFGCNFCGSSRSVQYIVHPPGASTWNEMCYINKVLHACLLFIKPLLLAYYLSSLRKAFPFTLEGSTQPLSFSIGNIAETTLSPTHGITDIILIIFGDSQSCHLEISSAQNFKFVQTAKPMT